LIRISRLQKLFAFNTAYLQIFAKIYQMDDFKKYFDEQNYVTKIIGVTNDEAALEATNPATSSLIDLLTLPENKLLKEEALIMLKKEKRGDLLLKAIGESKQNINVLLAACWESEINFSEHLVFFVNHALSDDYLISLEAITVIDTMEGPFDEQQVKDSITKVKTAMSNRTDERAVLLNDLRDTLQRFVA
jgi:hypothetical protein